MMVVPSILYDEVGGGGDGTLDEFLDSLSPVFVGAVDEDFDPADGLEEDPFTSDYDEDTTDNTPTVLNQAIALQAAALMATFEGWWDLKANSLTNLGTAGSALDLSLGAGGAAPSFSTDHFVFDGVDDYMYCADNAAFALTQGQSFSFGIIATPKTAVVAGDTMIGHDAGGSVSLWRLAEAATNTFISTVADATTLNSTTGVATAVNTKALHVGVRDSRSVILLNNTHKVTGTTIVSATNTLGATGNGVIDAATQFRIGSKGNGTAFAEMDVYGAFFCKRVLTAFELIIIAAYYGA